MTEINKEIEKTLTEMESLMGVLYDALIKVLEEKDRLNSGLGTHDSSGPSSNDDLLAIFSMVEKSLGSEKDIKIRLDHLFDSSQPPLNEEKRLRYGFFELQEVLTKIVSGLPSGLVDEEGKIDEKFLNLLTNVSAASEKLRLEDENKEEEREVPTTEEFYELLKKVQNDEADSESDSEEKEWLENELKKEQIKNAELRKKLASFEAAEKDRNDQLRQAEEKEQQRRDEIGNELASIDHSVTSPNELSAEELVELLTKLKGIKNSLNGTNDEEQILKKNIGNDESKKLKELSVQLKLGKGRLNVEQRIADALADKGGFISEKRIEIKKEWLLKEEYINYPQTLYKMDTVVKINGFEREILQVIAERRNYCRRVIEILELGKKAIEDRNIGQAKEIEKTLLRLHEIWVQQGGDSNGSDIFLVVQFHVVVANLRSFIKEQQRMKAQILQSTK